MTSDFTTRLRQGTARAYLIGNFSSMRDPYSCCASTTAALSSPRRTSRHALALAKLGYDALIDRMGQTPTYAPEMDELYREAMEPLAGRVALHPPRPMAAPHSAQRDLLDQLA